MSKKILVADDDPDILEVIKIILESEGYDVKTTPNGEEVKNIENIGVDLILLDIRMSGVDGLEIARFLKEKETTKEIPVVMISANKDTGKAAKEVGADDYICKPFELDELITMVKKYADLD